MFPPWSEQSQTLKPGKYRHYKGGEYQVLGVAHHSETEEEMVVYLELYNNNEMSVRPLGMFMEHVEKEGYSGPRFVYINE